MKCMLTDHHSINNFYYKYFCKKEKKIEREGHFGLTFYIMFYGSWNSSVSTVSDYRLEDRATGIQSPAETKNFSSCLCVRTGSGVHPAPCPTGAGGSFSRGWSAAEAWRWPLTTSSADVNNEYEIYFLSPLSPAWRLRDSFFIDNVLWRQLTNRCT
jgi:hypothetical protein